VGGEEVIDKLVAIDRNEKLDRIFRIYRILHKAFLDRMNFSLQSVARDKQDWQGDSFPEKPFQKSAGSGRAANTLLRLNE
jgi:hypothetical protein